MLTNDLGSFVLLKFLLNILMADNSSVNLKTLILGFKLHSVLSDDFWSLEKNDTTVSCRMQLQDDISCFMWRHFLWPRPPCSHKSVFNRNNSTQHALFPSNCPIYYNWFHCWWYSWKQVCQTIFLSQTIILISTLISSCSQLCIWSILPVCCVMIAQIFCNDQSPNTPPTGHTYIWNLSQIMGWTLITGLEGRVYIIGSWDAASIGKCSTLHKFPAFHQHIIIKFIINYALTLPWYNQGDILLLLLPWRVYIWKRR